MEAEPCSLGRSGDGSSVNRSNEEKLSPQLVFVISLLVGAVLPVLYYFNRVYRPSDLFWELPGHKIGKLLIGLALAGVVGLALGPGEFKPVTERVGRMMSRLPRAAIGVLTWIRGLVVVVAVGLFFNRFQYRVIMGDGPIWFDLASDPFIMGSEPLGRWMHYLSYQLVALIGIDSGEAAVRLSSVASGMILAGGTLVLARGALGRIAPGAAVWFMLASPWAIVFASFVETTPIAYALTGLHLLAGLRYFRLGLKRPPWLETIFIMLAVWSHGMVLFSTGAQATLVAIWFFRFKAETSRKSPDAARVWRALALCIAPFSLLAGTMLFARFAGTGLEQSPWYGNARGGPDNRLWIDFTPSGDQTRYLFLEYFYIRDVLNLWLTSAPLLAIAPLALIDLFFRRRPEAVYLGAALGGLLLFSMTWNADFSIFWDFDLMAMFGVPAQILALLWWDERLGRGPAMFLAWIIGAVNLTLYFMPNVV